MDITDQVKHKVACIQDTIAAIAEVQQQLKVNCLQAKGGINSSISRQLETLRSREVWLLNQVDAIRHIKEDRLQGQLACLLHELGGFQHLMQMAQSSGNSCGDLKRELEETLCRLTDLAEKPLEGAEINFTSDVNQLRRAIIAYGTINSTGHTMEDYPMTDSLCHSVNELSLMEQAFAGLKSEESFPPFDAATSLSEWLAQNDTDGFEMLEGDDTAYRMMIPPYDVDQSSISPPLEAYFSQVNQSPLAEWILDSRRIQAEYSMGKSYPYAVMKYFREVSDDVKGWLLDYEKSQEEEEEKSMECQASEICHCTGPPEGFVMKPIEIENLDQLLCVQDPFTHEAQKKETTDKNMWLRSDADSSKNCQTTTLISLPSLKSACRANEPCCTFTECVCDTNCAVTAIAESHPSCKDPEQVFAYFQSVSKNPTDWLAVTTPHTDNPFEGVKSVQQSSKNQSHWLKDNPESAPASKSDTHEFAYFQSVLSTDPSDWLQKQLGNPISLDATACPPDSAMKRHSDEKITYWLREVSTADKAEEMQESELSKDDENEKWLHQSGSSSKGDDRQEDTTSGWEVVQKFHAQLSNSDWLTLKMQPSSKCEWLMDSSSKSSTSSPSPSVSNVEAFKLFLRLGDGCDNSEWLKQ